MESISLLRSSREPVPLNPIGLFVGWCKIFTNCRYPKQFWHSSDVMNKLLKVHKKFLRSADIGGIFQHF